MPQLLSNSSFEAVDLIIYYLSFRAGIDVQMHLDILTSDTLDWQSSLQTQL